MAAIGLCHEGHDHLYRTSFLDSFTSLALSLSSALISIAANKLPSIAFFWTKTATIPARNTLTWSAVWRFGLGIASKGGLKRREVWPQELQILP